MRSGSVAAVVLFVLVAGMLSGQDRPATVYLVGVQHAPGQLVSPRMSPAHVRLALDAIRPDVVGVESNPDWFAEGRFYRETWEAFGVAVPWATARGAETYGIDWIGQLDDDWSDRQRLGRVAAERAMLRASSVDARVFSYGAVTLDQLTETEGDRETDFLLLNGDAYARRWTEWQDGGRDKVGSPERYMARRNAEIADLIAAAARRHGKSRLLVVIGAAHRGDLLRILPLRGVPVGDTAPMMREVEKAGEAAMDARLDPIDAVAILSHAFDGERGMAPPVARRDRLEKQLATGASGPAAAPGLRLQHRYLRARSLMLRGDLDAAVSEFAALAGEGATIRFPYRGESWRLHLTIGEAASLEVGRIADLQNRRPAALSAYRALLEKLEEPAFDAGYHSDFEFQARARNAVRALIEAPFTRTMAYARRAPATPSAATAAGDTDSRTAGALARTWELHRAKKWGELRDSVDAIDRAAMSDLERIELDFHLAAASIELGNTDDAVKLVGALERRVAELGGDHWLSRSLPALRERLALK
jgi:hypothetical protein